MGFSDYAVKHAFASEVARKRSMAYKYRPKSFPMNGFWRPQNALEARPATGDLPGSNNPEIFFCSSELQNVINSAN